MNHFSENTDSYRRLTEQEIDLLKARDCHSEDWSQVLIRGIFDGSRYHNTRFSGTILIGEQSGQIELFGGVKKNCGVYNVHIHNCTLGNNVYVNHIKNYIANYAIEDHVIIDNADICAVEGICSFGNGIKVQVLDETGGRKVTIYDKLSAHLAYLMAFYKHRDQAIATLEEMITAYTEKIKACYGVIGHHSRIFNCRKIINVRIGPHTFIDGASMLENGSLNGNADAPVRVGNDAILRNFIVSSGSEVSDGAIVADCFIGQGCVLGSQYSAQQSLFFANCQGFHGEACSIFAGPYTVTHHKSTLLIAGMFSFCNAGSGSNQSNHMYKLGPIHHGIVERGSKTTSDSYLLWPAKIGAFTLVMGRHYKNSDTSDMPFSYLIENDDESWLAPGVNLKSIGTIRDVMKWPRRDKRTDPCKMDHINFNLLSPFTISKMHKAIQTLEQIRNISGETTEVFSYNNTKIKSESLKRGIELYRLAILKFIGNSVITRLNQCPLSSPQKVAECLTPKGITGIGEWIDLSGLFAPKTEVDRLLNSIEDQTVSRLGQVEDFFKELHNQYYEYEWNWTAEFIGNYLHKAVQDFSVEELIDMVREWRESVIAIDKMLYEDAKKEFRMSAMTGFGIDGDRQVRQQDFERVRGRFEDNDFVKEICNHIEKKKNLGNRVIQQLKEAQKLPII